MLTIPANALKAALTHAAVKDIRYYLQGVRLEATQAGDLHIVATDGYRMFVGRLAHAAQDAPEFTHLTIPLDVIKRAPKTGHLTLARNGELWQLGAEVFKPVDGTFPDWRRVVPASQGFEPGEEPPQAFNFEYLADAQAALRTWSNAKHATVTRRDYRFASVVVSGDPTAFCIVVPVRGTEKAPLVFADPFKPAAARQ